MKSVCLVAAVGIPSDLVELSDEDLQDGDAQTAEDFERILGDPRMQEVLDQHHLRAPSCTSSALVDSAGREVVAGTRVACALYETRSDGSACEGAGKIDRGVHGGARVCQLCQAGDDAAHPTDAFGLDVSSCDGASGWSYEPDGASCSAGGEIAFTPRTRADPGSVVYLECRWPAA